MKPQPPRSRRLLILLGFALVAGGVLHAQTASPQAPSTMPAQQQQQQQQSPPSPAVRLSVIVTDKSNRVVGDLRQEDFRVEENGVPQTITHFAREESPVSYTLVVDNSGSLRSMLDKILAAGGALVSANKPGDETSLTRFIGSDQITVVEDFTDHQLTLMSGLSNMYVEQGQTAVIDAVYLSALRLAERRATESGRRRSLVLLTDGEDRVSYYKKKELEELLRKLDVQVFAVGIVSLLKADAGFIRKSSKESAMALLNSLTRETGGRVFFPKNVKELQEAVADIARDLRTQYVIGYQSSNANPDGKFRKVQVKLSETASGDKRVVHTRSGYFAPGAKGEENKASPEKSPRLRLP